MSSLSAVRILASDAGRKDSLDGFTTNDPLAVLVDELAYRHRAERPGLLEPLDDPPPRRSAFVEIADTDGQFSAARPLAAKACAASTVRCTLR